MKLLGVTFTTYRNQYKNLYTISNNIEVYEDQVWRTKKIPHCAVKFESGKENRIGTKVCTEPAYLNDWMYTEG